MDRRKESRRLGRCGTRAALAETSDRPAGEVAHERPGRPQPAVLPSRPRGQIPVPAGADDRDHPGYDLVVGESCPPRGAVTHLPSGMSSGPDHPMGHPPLAPVDHHDIPPAERDVGLAQEPVAGQDVRSHAPPADSEAAHLPHWQANLGDVALRRREGGDGGFSSCARFSEASDLCAAHPYKDRWPGGARQPGRRSDDLRVAQGTSGPCRHMAHGPRISSPSAYCGSASVVSRRLHRPRSRRSGWINRVFQSGRYSRDHGLAGTLTNPGHHLQPAVRTRTRSNPCRTDRGGVADGRHVEFHHHLVESLRLQQ